MAPYDDTPTVTSVSQFAKHVERVKRLAEEGRNSADLLFRGQPCDKPLMPRLGRLRPHGKLIKIEALVLEEFKRTSLPLTEFHPENDWDVIALAQHHGLPTRLLDWTQNAFAALWFAVREPSRREEPGRGSAPGVVWIFTPTVDDYRLDTGTTSPLDNSKRTRVFRPKVISRRIAAQSGVFTVHKIVEEKRCVALEKNKNYRLKLVKLLIPAEKFGPLRKALHIFGINDSSQFPDLDGLCKHLQWRFFDDAGARE